MSENKITKYFSETINTIFGRCFVEGFNDDKTSIILYEHGEPFTYSIEDFLSEIREYN